MHPRIGQTIAHFRIDALAGEGGMGTVYRAFDTRLERPVALKFLRPEVTDSPEARQRFNREARAAAKLAHPNIAMVHDLLELDGQLVIVSEWVEGATLEGAVFQSPSSWPQALEILSGVAAGLDAAHAAGIIHRDIKPSNIIRGTSGWVKICDFGVARLPGTTATGSVLIGTPERIAPEQWLGQEIDYRADIFALGVMAYELLTGRIPFHADDPAALGYQIVHEPHADPSQHNPDLPKAADNVIGAALAKSRESRPSTATEFVARLRSALPTGRAETRPSRRPKSLPPKRRLLLAGAALLILAVAVFAILSVSGKHMDLAAEAVAAVQSSNPDRLPKILVLRTNATTPDALAPGAGLSEALYRTFRDRSGFAVVDFESTPTVGESPDWKALRTTTGADFALATTVTGGSRGLSCNAQMVSLQSGQPIWESSYADIPTSEPRRVAGRVLNDLSVAAGWSSPADSSTSAPDMEFRPAVQKWLDRGHRYMELKEYALAEEMYDSALTVSGNELLIRYWIGKAKAAQGRHKEAIRDFELALADAPKVSAFLWDTSISIPPSACGTAFQERSGHPPILIYDDSLDNSFHVSCFDPVGHTVHSSTHARESGFPYVFFHENSPGPAGGTSGMTTGFDRLAGDTVRLKIIDSAGRTLGLTGPMPFDVHGMIFGITTCEDLFWMRYPSLPTRGNSAVDSIAFFSKSGSRLGSYSAGRTAVSTASRWSVRCASGFVCVCFGDGAVVYSVTPWLFQDSVRLPGVIQDFDVYDGLFAFLTANGHVMLYDPSQRRFVWEGTNGDSLITLRMRGISQGKRLLVTDSRTVTVLGRARPGAPPRPVVSEQYGATVEPMEEGDSLWVFSQNGKTDLFDLGTGKLLRQFESGPTWEAARDAWGPGLFHSLRAGILLASGRVLSLYDRATMNLRWRREFEHQVSLAAVRSRNAIFVMHLDGTFSLLNGTTGKTVRQHNGPAFLMDELGESDRVFVGPGIISSEDTVWSMAELSTAMDLHPVERWEVQEGIGFSLLASGDPRGAVSAFQASLREYVSPSSRMDAGLEESYLKLGLTDSAFLALHRAVLLSTTVAGEGLPLAEFLKVHWHGEIITRLRSESRGPFDWSGELLLSTNGVISCLDTRWIVSERAPTLVSETGKICSNLQDKDAEGYPDVLHPATIRNNVGLLWTDAPPMTSKRDTILGSSITLWDVRNCRQLWSHTLESPTQWMYRAGLYTVSPRGFYDDTSRVVIVAPSPGWTWDSANGMPLVDRLAVSVINASNGENIGHFELRGRATVRSKGYQISPVGRIEVFAITRLCNGSNTLVAQLQDSIQAFDCASGRRRWSVPTLHATKKTNIFDHGVAMSIFNDSMVCITFDSLAYGLSLTDGSLQWKCMADSGDWIGVFGGRFAAWSHRDTIKVQYLSRSSPGKKSRPLSIVIPKPYPKPYEYRSLRFNGRHLIAIDRDFGSREASFFTLVNPESGKIEGKFRFATPLDDLAIDGKNFYGLLRDGTLFRAALDKLIAPD